MDDQIEVEESEEVTFEQAWLEFQREPRHPKSVALSLRRKRMMWGVSGVILLVFTVVMYVVEGGGIRDTWWFPGALAMILHAIMAWDSLNKWAEIETNTKLVWEQAPVRALEVMQSSVRFSDVMERRAREDAQDELLGKVKWSAIIGVVGLGIYGVAQLLWPDMPPGLTGLMIGLTGLAGVLGMLLTGLLSLFLLVDRSTRREEDVEMKHIKMISSELFSGDVTGGLSIKDDTRLKGALGLDTSQAEKHASQAPHDQDEGSSPPGR